MRLDKFLCDMEQGSRRQVRELIQKGAVKVNGTVVRQPDAKIKEETDLISLYEEPIVYRQAFYYMMNKPAGYITATKDDAQQTVMDLFPKELRRSDLFPVGRLDKDTTGLLLFTNQGDLAHKLLSAKYHVDKTYRVLLRDSLSMEAKSALEQGVSLGKDGVTLPAKCDIISDDAREVELTIREGKFHQVKRMMHAVENEVAKLTRIAFAGITLPKDLKAGEIRELTQAQSDALWEHVKREDKS